MSEERSREIEEAARRYAAYRAANWKPSLPMFLVVAGAIALPAVTSALVDRLAVPALVVLVPISLLVSLALLAVAMVVYTRLGDQGRLFPRDVTIGELHGKRNFRFWSLVGGISGGIAGAFGVPLVHMAEGVAPHLQPLLGVAFFLPFTIAGILIGRRRYGEWPWRRYPLGYLPMLIAMFYAIAAAAGMPQPWAAIRGHWGVLLRAVGPLYAGMIINVFVGEWYSRRQFRRLQRLVNEETDGTG